jgi:hypothetical protein
MHGFHLKIASRAKLLAFLLAAILVAACATPPPKPAMVPLGQTGEFGYSERDLGPDRIEVTYTGAYVPIAPSGSRDDPRVKAEQAKVHDLALWRAAQLADQRGMAGMKIENETRNTDVHVTQDYVRSLPPYGPYHWGDPYYWGGPSWFYDDYPYYRSVRRASAQSVSTLTVRLLKTYDSGDKGQFPVKDTLTNLQSARAGAAY